MTHLGEFDLRSQPQQRVKKDLSTAEMLTIVVATLIFGMLAGCIALTFA